MKRRKILFFYELLLLNFSDVVDNLLIASNIIPIIVVASMFSLFIVWWLPRLVQAP